MVLLDFGFRRGRDRAVSGRVGDAVGIWSAVTVVKVAGGGG